MQSRGGAARYALNVEMPIHIGGGGQRDAKTTCSCAGGMAVAAASCNATAEDHASHTFADESSLLALRPVMGSDTCTTVVLSTPSGHGAIHAGTGMVPHPAGAHTVAFVTLGDGSGDGHGVFDGVARKESVAVGDGVSVAESDSVVEGCADVG